MNGFQEHSLVVECLGMLIKQSGLTSKYNTNGMVVSYNVNKIEAEWKFSCRNRNWLIKREFNLKKRSLADVKRKAQYSSYFLTPSNNF